MNKFINSKGLSASKDNSFFSPFITNNGNGFLRNSTDEYYELRPPQFVKKDLNVLKRRVSAICKIQEELKEMKAREEELMYLFTLLFNLSINSFRNSLIIAFYRIYLIDYIK